jgi:ferredoxin
MNAVETVVGEANVPKGRVHLERFVMADHKTTRASYRAGDTLLQTARTAGLKAPASCETGSCGTCMAKIVEGTVRMLNNDALDDDEVEEGWVLTCQSLPTSSTVSVEYE